MENGTCTICKKETDNLWLINLAQIDSFEFEQGKNIRQRLCEDCAVTVNEVVKDLSNGNSMAKAFNKAGLKNQNKETVKTVTKTKAGSRAETQNTFLGHLLNSNRLVQIEATEGIGWRGYIKSFDDFSLMISNEGDQKEILIFKHAIKSIKPIYTD